MIQDRREDMLAWWEEIEPSHWVYVEGDSKEVVAEVRPVDHCFWFAQLADGEGKRFRLRKRAIEWCEVEVLQRAILA